MTPSERKVGSRTVAIVDDDPVVGHALARLLQLAGFAPREFDSAESFLASNLEAKAVPLILDVRMPGLDGPGLFRRLLAQHGDYPVIFISAVDDGRTREDVRALGARGWLSKPVDSEALLALLGEPGGEPAAGERSRRAPAHGLIGPSGPEAKGGARK